MKKSLYNIGGVGLALAFCSAGVLTAPTAVGAAPVVAKSLSAGLVAAPPLQLGTVGRSRDGTPKLASPTATGLSPAAIQAVYGISGSSPTSRAGRGQIIAIVDAFRDPHALADLNTFDAQYGYPAMPRCVSLSQTRACFAQYSPGGTPVVMSHWALEESLDIQWAHAEAPGAKIVLVQANTGGLGAMFAAVSFANSIGANEVSMSWGVPEFSGESKYDSYLTNPGTVYTTSAGDKGHKGNYPAASPNVLTVGGTTLNGCKGTSCSTSVTETAWSGSGGGASLYEPLPTYQSNYNGLVYGAPTIGALTGNMRGIPDVSFDGDPHTGVSVYDSTAYNGQSGWFTVGGTSVGAPSWAGLLAAANAAGTMVRHRGMVTSSVGYVRDVTSGTNGTCGTDCTAGAGYDLVTGLGSPVDYP